jgi:phosphate starvation-inducible PhoH-like protein
VQLAATRRARALPSWSRAGTRSGPATIESVARVLDQAESPSQVLDDVVWRHRNLKVAPKSVNQKRYVDAIRRSTVTFGVGPAGTGKTFLAIAMATAALSRREVNRIILTRPAVEAASGSASCPAT